MIDLFLAALAWCGIGAFLYGVAIRVDDTLEDARLAALVTVLWPLALAAVAGVYLADRVKERRDK